MHNVVQNQPPFPVRYSHPRLGILETEDSFRARHAKWWMTGVPDRIPERYADYCAGRGVDGPVPYSLDTPYIVYEEAPPQPDRIPVRHDAEPRYALGGPVR